MMASFFSSNLQPNYQITVDLDASYHIPSHIASTDLRPDIVMWSDLKKTVLLIELTVCFETNYAEARERKRNKYLSLKAEIQGRGYCALIVPIQVGSRGMLEVEGFDSLKPYLNNCGGIFLSTLLKQQSNSLIRSGWKGTGKTH